METERKRRLVTGSGLREFGMSHTTFNRLGTNSSPFPESSQTLQLRAQDQATAEVGQQNKAIALDDVALILS